MIRNFQDHALCFKIMPKFMQRKMQDIKKIIGTNLQGFSIYMLLLFTIAFISVNSRDMNNASMTELELGVYFNIVFSHLILIE